MHRDLKQKADVIRKWNQGLLRGVTLGLIRTAHPQSAILEGFIRDFLELAPRIRMVEVQGQALPGLIIGDGWHLHFIPEGTELEPFLDLLSAIDREETPIPKVIQGMLENRPCSLSLTLFVSTYCPNCPNVLRQVAPLPLVNRGIRLTVIDGLLFPELASEYSIQAVPTLLSQDGLRWTGQIRLADVLASLLGSEEDRIGREALERMITDGNAQALADNMIRAQSLFPAMLDLLTHEVFSLRLGAMVVMEDLGERAPQLARSALEPLWERMPRVEEAVQGDIIYLIGEIGDATWVPRLEALLHKAVSPDLEEALQDALRSLASR